MQQFIGTKIINAKPMNRLNYNIFRGWKLPDDEDGTDEGYLVEYVNGGKPNTVEYASYVSWSPREQFDNAYKASGNLSFGNAIEYMKLGYKVARKGWNSKGIFIELQIPTESSKMTSPYISIDTTGLQTNNEFDHHSLVPWLASQTDMLTEDWEVL
jgi:Protein of unknown function (DUF2829)